MHTWFTVRTVLSRSRTNFAARLPAQYFKMRRFVPLTRFCSLQRNGGFSGEAKRVSDWPRGRNFGGVPEVIFREGARATSPKFPFASARRSPTHTLPRLPAMSAWGAPNQVRFPVSCTNTHRTPLISLPPSVFHPLPPGPPPPNEKAVGKTCPPDPRQKQAEAKIACLCPRRRPFPESAPEARAKTRV